MADVRGGDGQVQGAVAAGSPDSTYSVKGGALYDAAPPVYNAGDRVPLLAEGAGRLVCVRG